MAKSKKQEQVYIYKVIGKTKYKRVRYNDRDTIELTESESENPIFKNKLKEIVQKVRAKQEEENKKEADKQDSLIL